MDSSFDLKAARARRSLLRLQGVRPISLSIWCQHQTREQDATYTAHLETCNSRRAVHRSPVYMPDSKRMMQRFVKLNTPSLLLVVMVTISSSIVAATPNLGQDVVAISGVNIKRGPLERTDEQRARIDAMHQKFSNREYEITLPRETTQRSWKAFSYEADTSTLTVTLPELELKSLEGAGSSRTYYSYAEAVFDCTPYKVRVVREAGRRVQAMLRDCVSYGGAVVSMPNQDMKAQQFDFKVARPLAAELISSGRVVLRVRAELQPSFDDPLLKDDDQLASPESPFVTMRQRIMLPVKLLSLSIRDRRGVEVLAAEGRQQAAPLSSKD